MKQWIPVFISVAMTAACLFGAAGRLDWTNAWVLLVLSLLTGLAFTLGRDPELAAERRSPGGGKSWDKLLVGLTVLIGPIAMWITAGLDQRFHWTLDAERWPLPAGIASAIAAAALIAWAMRTNRFFSSVVRIQKDRGHVVIDSGPYSVIRHPGYAGMIVYTLVTPLILGSHAAMWPALGIALLTVLRTALEDRTLVAELPGYEEYTRRVRCRLLPPLW